MSGCSYCRITGKSRILPHPKYPPLIPLPKPNLDEIRRKFCRVTGHKMESHHYSPLCENGESAKLATPRSRRCRVMTKSHSMENHHYTPSFEDVPFHQALGCRITQHEAPSGYNFIYPLLYLQEQHALNNDEMRLLQCTITHEHHFIPNYKYVRPVLDNDQEEELVRRIKKELKLPVENGHVEEREVLDEHKYVYPVLNEECGVILPAGLEDLLRCGQVEHVLLSTEGDKMLIETAAGSIELSTASMSLEQVHEELLTEKLMPGCGAGKKFQENVEENGSRRPSLKMMRRHFTLDLSELPWRRSQSPLGSINGSCPSSPGTPGSSDSVPPWVQIEKKKETEVEKLVKEVGVLCTQDLASLCAVVVGHLVGASKAKRSKKKKKKNGKSRSMSLCNGTEKCPPPKPPVVEKSNKTVDLIGLLEEAMNGKVNETKFLEVVDVLEKQFVNVKNGVANKAMEEVLIEWASCQHGGSEEAFLKVSAQQHLAKLVSRLAMAGVYFENEAHNNDCKSSVAIGTPATKMAEWLMSRVTMSEGDRGAKIAKLLADVQQGLFVDTSREPQERSGDKEAKEQVAEKSTRLDKSSQVELRAPTEMTSPQVTTVSECQWRRANADFSLFDEKQDGDGTRLAVQCPQDHVIIPVLEESVWDEAVSFQCPKWQATTIPLVQSLPTVATLSAFSVNVESGVEFARVKVTELSEGASIASIEPFDFTKSDVLTTVHSQCPSTTTQQSVTPKLKELRIAQEIVVGRVTTNAGTGLITIQPVPSAAGCYSWPLGRISTKDGERMVVLGQLHTTEGPKVIALGQIQTEEGPKVVAIGQMQTPDGIKLVALGQLDTGDEVEGMQLVSIKHVQTPEGNKMVAVQRIRSHDLGTIGSVSSLGMKPIITEEGTKLTNVGKVLTTDGVISVALGQLKTSEGPKVVTLGQLETPDGPKTVALTQLMTQEGIRTVPLGQIQTAKGPKMVVLGQITTAEGPKLVALASIQTSNGPKMMAIGQIMTSSGSKLVALSHVDGKSGDKMVVVREVDPSELPDVVDYQAKMDQVCPVVVTKDEVKEEKEIQTVVRNQKYSLLYQALGSENPQDSVLAAMEDPTAYDQNLIVLGQFVDSDDGVRFALGRLAEGENDTLVFQLIKSNSALLSATRVIALQMVDIGRGQKVVMAKVNVAGTILQESTIGNDDEEDDIDIDEEIFAGTTASFQSTTSYESEWSFVKRKTSSVKKKTSVSSMTSRKSSNDENQRAMSPSVKKFKSLFTRKASIPSGGLLSSNIDEIFTDYETALLHEPTVVPDEALGLLTVAIHQAALKGEVILQEPVGQKSSVSLDEEREMEKSIGQKENLDERNKLYNGFLDDEIPSLNQIPSVNLLNSSGGISNGDLKASLDREEILKTVNRRRSSVNINGDLGDIQNAQWTHVEKVASQVDENIALVEVGCGNELREVVVRYKVPEVKVEVEKGNGYVPRFIGVVVKACDINENDAFDLYVAIADYIPGGNDEDVISLWEGQIVEVLDSHSSQKWLVRTKPSKTSPSKQGWVPPSYLEKKTMTSTLRSIQEILEMEADSKTDSVEREAQRKRTQVVKELIETEEEFAKDMMHVVKTYLRDLDNPRVPKEIRDLREAIFLNFEQICDFHNNVLMKGVQYYASEPARLGRIFLRLERDFDLHVNYCRDLQQSQMVLSTSPAKEYFEQYSQRIGEGDKTLQSHLKLPIQRINDYQLLLKELIKYSARLKEDCTDLQRALDLMLSIPQRAQDLEFINSIQGYKGNLLKLGRLLRHDWFTVTDNENRVKERYLFIFKSRILVTKLRRVSEDRSIFILKDIIRLPEVEVKANPTDKRLIEVYHKDSSNQRYPLSLLAKTEFVREAWLKEIKEFAEEIVDLGEEEIKVVESQQSIGETSKEVIKEVSKQEDTKEIGKQEDTKEVSKQEVTTEEVIKEVAKQEAGKEIVKQEVIKETTTQKVVQEEVKQEKKESISVIKPEKMDGVGESPASSPLPPSTSPLPPSTLTWLQDNLPIAPNDWLQLMSSGQESPSSDRPLQSPAHTPGLLEEPKVDSRPTTPGGTLLPHAPNFTMKFKDTELVEESSVTFMVKVRSHPEAQVKFFKDGKDLVVSDRVKLITEDVETFQLVITHVNQEDAGVYSCHAKNSEGEATSEANVTVTSCKKVFMGMEDKLAEVAVNGGEDVDFSWYRDGQEFEASDRFKVMYKDEEDTLALVFQHVKPDDAGLYTCVANTASGKIACSAELTVQGTVNQLLREPEKPQITAELTDTEVSAGGSAMLELKVKGFPKPKITWYRDGEEVVSGGRYRFLQEDDESYALIIKNVAKEDSGNYKVVAKNELGEAVTTGNLIVKIQPKFKVAMKDICVMMDELVRFQVEIEGKPTPDITWYKDGRPVIATGRIQTLHETEESFALIIKKVQTDDAGTYSCQASNSSGKISEFSKLTVNAPPTFVKEIKRIECKETETIKFEAKVAGDPIPKVSWSVNGEEIKIDGKHFRTEEDDKIFTLTVDSVTRKDAGNFTCTLKNEFGSTSSSADLVVNCSPEFEQKLKDMTVKDGDVDVKFDVKLSGTPEPKIRWFIDGMEIDEKKNTNYKTVDDGTKHTLVIKKVTPDVSGTFTIKASNSVGEISSNAVLTVLSKPNFTQKLTDIEVTEGENVTYTVKCTGNPEPKIKWFKNNQDITVDAKIKFTHQSSETWTMTLDCVAASAAGKYEARASNTEGESSTESKLTVNILQVDDAEVEGTIKIKEEIEKSYEEDSNEMTITLNDTENEGQESTYTRIETTEKASFELVEDGNERSLTAEFEKDMTILKENIVAGELDSEFSEERQSRKWDVSEEMENDKQLALMQEEEKPESDERKESISEPAEQTRKSSGEEDMWWLEEEEVITTQVTHELKTKEDVEVNEEEVEIPELQVDVNLKQIVREDLQTPSSAEVEGGVVIEEIESPEMKDEKESDLDGAKPKFGKGLADVDAWLGLQAILEVEVDAIPEAEVKWLKDGKPITAGGKIKIEKSGNLHRLLIAETSTEDSGSYKCIIKNKIGEETSQATLTVKTPADAKGPVFTHPIQNVACIKGSSATFQVAILGNPAPLIKWMKDGKEITEGDKYHMERVPEDYLYRLVVDKCVEGDAGKYAVFAANEHGEDTSEAKLDVKVPPEITPPENYVALPKASATVEAKVTGSPQPKVIWCRNGKPLTEGAKFKSSADDVKGVYTLVMNQVDLDDGGEYEVVAENDAGKMKKAFQLLFTTDEPKFTKPLTPQKIKPTKSVTMDVEVDGIPMPTVSWFLGGVELASNDHITLKQNSENSYSLIIENFEVTDEGEYECRAKSAVGQAVSKGKISTKHEKPIFSKHLPKETCAIDGETFVLEGKVDGSPQPAVKWLKDGKEIEPSDRIKMEYLPDGTARLTVQNAKASDRGKYSLVATNDSGELTSTGAVTVEAVPKPPVIIGELKKTKVIEGAPLQLSAKITGHPKPTVKWFKDGKPIKHERAKLSEAPDGTFMLSIENAQLEDAGKYTIQVSNPLGECSSTADVSVDAPQKIPEFGVKINACNAFEGYPIKLEGKVKGHPTPTLKWLKDGQEITPDGERIVASMEPDGSFGLLINNAKPEDKGKYTCVATNPEGSAESSADVGVNPRAKEGEPTSEPLFITPLRDVTVDEGTPLKLQAHVAANPVPDLVWKKDGTPLSPTDPRLSISFDGDRVSLEVKRTSPSDAGAYECTLTNPQGTSSSTCNVGVKKLSKPPFFTQRFPDLDAIISQDAKFVCRIAGLPTPDVSWYFNDKPIYDSEKYKIKREGDLHALYVKNCTADDIGNIGCVAKNCDGEDKCVAFLNVAAKLDKKTKTEAPSFLKRLADCEVIEGMPGKFTACISGFPEPEYKWYKDGRELFPSDRIKFEVEPHGLLRLIIRDIKPNDIGRYQLKISNVHGQAESEAALRCEASEDKRPKKMLDLEFEYDKLKMTGIPFALPDKPIISKMTDRRLTLSWKPSIPRGPRVPVTYIVEMCEVRPEADWLNIRQGIRGCCCEIKNLEPYQDYKFRVRVENKYGLSDPSPYATAYRTKLEMTPPRILPHLPPELDFRPETSPYFPKDFDFDRPLHEQYAHAPRFLRQDMDAQYGIRNQPSSIQWFVYGYPVPTISWYFNEEKIEVLGRYESSFSRNGQATLYINRFLERDIGIYECIAINEHGEARQRVRMEISESPVFISFLEETSIVVRESGRLECRLIGVPYPEIKWYKDWHPIVSTDRIKIEWKEPNLCSLSINGAINKDSGLYSCAARNVSGTTQCSAMLTIEESESDYMSLMFDRNRVIRASNKKLFEDFYDIGDELGRGTQGTIYHTVERSTGNSYAAKIMHGKGEFRDYMNHELDIMNNLHDRYLIRGIDAFDTKKGLTLITELASGGLLLDSLCRQSVLTESEIAYYIRQTLWGLEHMHGKGIAHLGLTPGDILLARPGGDDIKICDFGLSRRLIKGQDYILDYGMPEYVAPEIANGHSVSFYTDIWSVGVITYILLSGISPFLGENDRQTLQQVQQGKINFDTEVFSHISDEAKDFILKLLVFDQYGRMDVKTALRHPWLKVADRPGSGEGFSTERLNNYYRRYKDWYSRSACRRFYRRRPLSSAYSHPSKMVYPPEEEYTPPSSPEIDRVKPAPWDTPGFSDKVDREHENLEYELGYVDSESRYQNGPDTYLLQLRDIGLPLRLREYMRVAGCSSPSLGVRMIDTLLGKTVTIHERRRFTDIMDEEIDDEKKGVSDSAKKRISAEVSPRSETKNRLRELMPQRMEDGETPFFREKISDVAFVEGEDVELTCMAVGTPKPTVQWYRNDIMLSETHRLKFIETPDGRSSLRFTPIKAFDAGIFKAIARNPIADTSCRARLRLGDIPGRMEAPEVKQISNSQALLVWVPPKTTGNAVIGGYDLEQKEHGGADWESSCTNIDHEFFIVHGLKSQTSYQFRVRAANRFGRGEFSVPSEAAVTGDEASEAITISKAQKHQQELSEGRKKELDFTYKEPVLDYSIEDNPIELSKEGPTDKFNFLSEITRGQFSVVLKCCSKEESGDNFYAAKIIDGSPENEEKAKHEYEMFSSIRHQRIAVLYQAFLHNTNYVLIMEKLQGYDVLTYLTSRHQYNEEIVTKIVTQLLDALQYLHYRQIVHLDLQPDNVVMTSLQLTQVKLVDLGSAQLIPRSGNVTLSYQPSLLDYRAPEVVSNGDVNCQADVWSLGVLTYVLLSGASPYLGSDETETKENINFVRYRFENLYKEITPEATRFLMQIFKKTPFKRLTVDESLEHKWLNPSELMLRKRERAVFLSSRLQQYATDYHKQRLENASRSANLASSLGMQVERSISMECDTTTTF